MAKQIVCDRCGQAVTTEKLPDKWARIGSTGTYDARFPECDLCGFCADVISDALKRIPSKKEAVA